MADYSLDIVINFDYFPELLRRVETVSKEGSRRMAEDVLADARTRAPYLTGELRGSGHVVYSPDGAQVVFDSDHALYVEFGTYKMAAQPYLRPACLAAESRAASYYTSAFGGF